MNRIIPFLLLTAVLFIVVETPAEAQHDPWGVDLRMYVLGAGIEGSVGALGRTADVNLSFGDILSNLEFGFMGGVRAHKGPWSINTDVIYTGLGMENNLVNADVDQWIVDADIGYQFVTNVDAFGGVRFNALRSKLHFKVPPTFSVNPDKSWADPVIGLRATPPIGKKWALSAEVGIGGFGAGSKFTYEVQALLVRHFSKRTSLDLGYRILGINYDKREDAGQFLYDVTISGPEAGLTLSF